MPPLLNLVLSLLACTSIVHAHGGHPGTDPETWTKPRSYHGPFDPAFADRVIVLDATSADLPDAPPTPATDHVRTFVLLGAETDSPEIFVSSGSVIRRITIKNAYANFPTEARWINEKLLFIRVHWGRVIASDYIFDAQLGKIIHREMLHDGTLLFRQANEAKEENPPAAPAPSS